MVINHMRAVKAWMEAHGGQAKLDLLNFELEVKAHHRYFELHPQFLANMGGRFGHVGQLSPEVTGFIGWLPYRPIRLALSSDKIQFKDFLAQAGLPTPAMWARADQADRDFIIKRSIGSFGYDLAGPFQPGQAPDADTARKFFAPSDRPGIAYAEQFVRGRNIKVWCWGGSAFHAHVHPYPEVRGDGRSDVRSLVGRLLAESDLGASAPVEQTFIEQSLRYQGVDLDTVLEPGRAAWVDYRYGRRFTRQEKTGRDNDLPSLDAAAWQQVDHAARRIADRLFTEMALPVLFSLDGVIDDAGKIWWLEMNSNPIFPPTGYAHMLATLFGQPGPARTGPVDATAQTPEPAPPSATAPAAT